MTEKYESAFDLRSNTIKSSKSLIQEGWDYYKDGDKVGKLELNSNLICPECMQAHLEVAVGPQRYYIKKIKDSEHEKDCYFEVKVAGKRELKKYFSDKDPLTIENELGHLLDSRVYVGKNNDDKALDSVKRTHSEMVFHPKDSNDNVKRRIPQRKLNNSLFEKLNLLDSGDSFGPAYFYGSVKVTEKSENSSYKNYNVVLSSNDDCVLSFGIFKGDTNIIDKLNDILDSNCMIAFKGEIKVDGSEKHKFFDVNISDEHYLVIKK